jgi:hypothetical protein
MLIQTVVFTHYPHSSGEDGGIWIGLRLGLVVDWLNEVAPTSVVGCLGSNLAAKGQDNKIGGKN